MISDKLLQTNNASVQEIKKGEILFNKGEHAHFYYQVKSGEIKMNNYNADGKEFIQSIFYEGQSFGEPPLFADIVYPAGAEAIVDSKVYKLPKADFHQLLKENPNVHFKITEVLSLRLYYKAIIASTMSSEEPERRIIKLFDYLKRYVHQIDEDEKFEVDLKRQQIADLTGLRVETVIRACKSLEEKSAIQIKNRKIIR